MHVSEPAPADGSVHPNSPGESCAASLLKLWPQKQQRVGAHTLRRENRGVMWTKAYEKREVRGEEAKLRRAGMGQSHILCTVTLQCYVGFTWLSFGEEKGKTEVKKSHVFTHRPLPCACPSAGTVASRHSLLAP